MEEELLKQIKYALSHNNESQAIRMIEQYGHGKQKQTEPLNIAVVSSRFDDIYTHPFRVGRKQGRAVLDAKGNAVVFLATEKQAELYCTYLNGY
jgi:hypothetical protein